VDAERALLAALAAIVIRPWPRWPGPRMATAPPRRDTSADGSEVRRAVTLDDPDGPARLAKAPLDAASPALKAMFER
jgi:hypothetical protein